MFGNQGQFLKEAVLAEVQVADLSTFFVAEIASIIRKLPTK